MRVLIVSSELPPGPDGIGTHHDVVDLTVGLPTLRPQVEEQARSLGVGRYDALLHDLASTSPP